MLIPLRGERVNTAMNPIYFRLVKHNRGVSLIKINLNVIITLNQHHK